MRGCQKKAPPWKSMRRPWMQPPLRGEGQQTGEPVRQGDDVVVHQPEPVVPVGEGGHDAGVEAPGPAGVLGQVDAPHHRVVAVLLVEELTRAVGAGVVDDVDGLQRPGLREERREQVGQELLAVVGDDHGGHRQVVEGVGGVLEGL